MELTEFEKYRKNRIIKRTCLTLLLITAFYAAVCTPLARIVSSDILLADTVLPLLFDAVMLYCSYAFYWVFFAALLYCVGAFGFRNSVGLIGSFVGIAAIHYLLNQVAGFFVIGFPTVDAYLEDYLLPELLVPILLDAFLIAGLGVLFVYLAYKKENGGSSVSERLFDLRVPHAFGALLLAIIPAAIQLLSRVLYDLTVGGLPLNVADLLWMIVSYASDILNILIGYLVIRMLWNRIFLREAIAKEEYDRTAFEDRL